MLNRLQALGRGVGPGCNGGRNLRRVPIPHPKNLGKSLTKRTYRQMHYHRYMIIDCNISKSEKGTFPILGLSEEKKTTPSLARSMGWLGHEPLKPGSFATRPGGQANVLGVSDPGTHSDGLSHADRVPRSSRDGEKSWHQLASPSNA